MKFGILLRWHSFWIGAHWSPYNKRLCINIIPFVTVWIAAKDGIAPEAGAGWDIYRNDDNWINKINSDHKAAIQISNTMSIANVDQVRNQLDHLLEKGASFAEAKKELQHQFGHLLEALQE